MKLKFCGIFRDVDVEFVNQVQPDYMGMILSPGFRRSISCATAARFAAKKCSAVKAVGVFVDETVETILQIVQTVGLDVVQLHGKETAEMISSLQQQLSIPVWKAARVQAEQDIRDAENLGADVLVLEGYKAGVVGGSGIVADWNLIRQTKPNQPFFLAGGLRPDTVKQAIDTVQPFGIDIASGIETDGYKDFEKMKQVAEILREGENKWEK